MKVVTFFNNKGGVGKTTTIINLASYLSIYREKKVLVVDLDPQSNSTQAILPEEIWLEFYDPENRNTRKTIYDYFRDMEEGDANFNNIEIPVNEDQNSFKISLIPGHPKLSIIDDTMSKSWSETLSGDKGAIRKLNWLNQLKKENTTFDYILIDCPAGIEQGFKNAIAGADRAIVVTTAEISSIRDADRIIGLLEASEIRNPELIINRLRPNMVKRGEMMDVDDIVDLLSIDLIGVIPDDEYIITQTNKGEPAVSNKKAPSGKAYLEIARRILGDNIEVTIPGRDEGFFTKLLNFFRRK